MPTVLRSSFRPGSDEGSRRSTGAPAHTLAKSRAQRIPLLLAAGLLVPLTALNAADLGGVTVKLDAYQGPATVTAQSVGPFKVAITVAPNGETKPLAIRVDLPGSGPRTWPADLVEVRDAQGKALRVRHTGIEWFKMLIPVPAVAGTYFVQTVPPPEGRLPVLPESGRSFVDEATGLRVGIAKWQDGRQAALSLRFDDSHPTHLTRAIPILREYGFRGTFMVNPGGSEPGSRRRSEFVAHQAEWAAVAQQGDQELGNHTAHHRGASGDADMEAEIGEAAQAIWKLTPGRSKLMALNLGGGTQWETTRPLRYYLDKYHQFDVSGSLGMDDVYGNRVAAFREHVERHLKSGLWCRVHFHYIGEGLSSSEANFRAALDIAKEHAARLWIAGMADIYKYQSERNAAKLTRQQSDARHLIFQFACLTDAELYDQPLTIELTPTRSLDPSRLKVKDAQGKAIPLRTAPAGGASVLRFHVVPRNAAYSIEVNP